MGEYCWELKNQINFGGRVKLLLTLKYMAWLRLKFARGSYL
jgi:hypothetical protein